MHPSPSYARLQIVSRIRAELIQQLRSLSSLSISGKFDGQLGNRFSLAVSRLERAVKTVEDEYVVDAARPATDARALERSVRAELRWLTQAVKRLHAASLNDSITIELCDDVLHCIVNRSNVGESATV